MSDNDRHISIVINGKEQTIPLNEDVRKTGEGEQAVPEDFQWVLPDQRSPSILSTFHSDDKSEHRPVKKKKKIFPRKKRITARFKRRLPFRHMQHPLLKKMWVSIVSAVFIGTSFGMMILMMFAGDHVQSQDNAFEGQAVPTEVEEDGEEVDLALDVELIQGGAFETLEGAKRAVEMLRANDFAAVIDETAEPFRLYVGLSENREGAERLVKLYEKSSEESYLKTVSLQPAADLEQEAGEILSEGKEAMLALISDATSIINEQERSSEGYDRYQAWQQKVESERESEGDNRALVETFRTHLHEAAQAIETYQETDEENMLWQAEQRLLNAFLEYKQLIGAKIN